MSDIRESMELIIKFAENGRQFRRDIEKLLEVDEWIREELHVHEGDAVVLKEDINATGGWYHYREILVKGSTGVANNIYLYKGVWRCYFTTDVSWSVSDYPNPLTRHGAGPKTFMLPIKVMRKRKKSDLGLTMPEGVIPVRTYGAAKV